MTITTAGANSQKAEWQKNHAKLKQKKKRSWGTAEGVVPWTV